VKCVRRPIARASKFGSWPLFDIYKQTDQDNPTRSAAEAILAFYIPCPSPDATDTALSAVSIALSDASPETLAPGRFPDFRAVSNPRRLNEECEPRIRRERL
jgi:hypothetical protein